VREGPEKKNRRSSIERKKNDGVEKARRFEVGV
jgi:hypothetical protein